MYPYLTLTKLSPRFDYQAPLATNPIGVARPQATYRVASATIDYLLLLKKIGNARPGEGD